MVASTGIRSWLAFTVFLLHLSFRIEHVFGQCEAQTACSSCLGFLDCNWCTPQGICLNTTATPYSGQTAQTVCETLMGGTLISSSCPANQYCGSTYAPTDCASCVGDPVCGYCNTTYGGRCFQSAFGSVQGSAPESGCQLLSGAWQCPAPVGTTDLGNSDLGGTASPGGSSSGVSTTISMTTIGLTSTGTSNTTDSVVFTIPPPDKSSSGAWYDIGTTNWVIIGCACGGGCFVCLAVFLAVGVVRKGKKARKSTYHY